MAFERQGKGNLGARFSSLLPRASLAISRAQNPLSLSNAYREGELIEGILMQHYYVLLA